MFSRDGQQSWNFFKNDLSNHIPATGLDKLPVALKFATSTKNIQQVIPLAPVLECVYRQSNMNEHSNVSGLRKIEIENYKNTHAGFKPV